MLNMGGHGVYVWSVVVISVLVIVGLLVLPAMSSRRFLASQRGAVEAEPVTAAPVVRIEEVNNAPGS
jgi:heme exporter protein CcmD